MLIAPRDKCTGCLACVDACAFRALNYETDSDGYYRIVADLDKCINCGRCSKVCPVIRNRVKPNDENYASIPYAVWCTNEALRANSASGGAFSGIAECFLRQGAIVYGAAFEGFYVRHRRITKIEDLSSIQGSKYQPSNMGGVYLQVKKDLQDNRIVLFSGLSCQVSALLNFVGNKLSEKLFTIDTICGGVSTLIPVKRLKDKGCYQGIYSYRDKEDGWKSRGYKYSLKTIRTDGSIDNLGDQNLIIETFNNRFLKRESCLDCKFNGFERVSDCTIGDFWGDRQFVDQHYKGLSVLVIHNSRIESFLAKSSLTLKRVNWEEVVLNNPCLYWNHYPLLKKLKYRASLLEILKKTAEDEVLLSLNKIPIFTKFLLRLYLRMNELEKKRRLDYCLKHTK